MDILPKICKYLKQSNMYTKMTITTILSNNIFQIAENDIGVCLSGDIYMKYIATCSYFKRGCKLINFYLVLHYD